MEKVLVVSYRIMLMITFIKKLKNRLIQFSIVLLILTSLVSCEKNATFTEGEFTSSWDTLQVLENPHKGWYHHFYDNRIDKYLISNDSIFSSFPGMDHIYLRLAWSFLEPKEGEFNWQIIDSIINKYVAKGYGISFRITSKETGVYPGSVGQEKDGVQFGMPFWVKESGAEGIVTVFNQISSWLPKWDDPVYLEKLDNFHKAFAQRYDGESWLRYVDVGSIGDWGEGHMWASSQKEASNDDIKAVIDIHLKNYKNAQIIVSDDILKYEKSDNDIEELYHYAVSNGISIRDDSPMVSDFIEDYLTSGSISHPHFYDSLYLSKPIILELQHYHDIKENGNWLGENGSGIIPKHNMSGAEIFRNAIKTMHATYIGYHGYAEDWLAENPNLTGEMLNHCGYWYFPERVTLPTSVKNELTLSVDWFNKGVAPAYNIYSIVFKFEAEDNSKEYEIIIEDSGNMKWMPDQIFSEQYKLDISKIASGNYQVKCKLIDMQSGDRREIRTGIAQYELDSGNFITLGKANIR